jgi:DNA-binding GntR family transcriptional regulator
MATLPAFDITQAHPNLAHHIYQYMLKLVNARLIPPITHLELPSITELSTLFNCSQLDLYDALQELQHIGYDYHFQKSNTPIVLWQNTSPALIRNRRRV